MRLQFQNIEETTNNLRGYIIRVLPARVLPTLNNTPDLHSAPQHFLVIVWTPLDTAPSPLRLFPTPPPQTPCCALDSQVKPFRTRYLRRASAFFYTGRCRGSARCTRTSPVVGLNVGIRRIVLPYQAPGKCSSLARYRKCL